MYQNNQKIIEKNEIRKIAPTLFFSMVVKGFFTSAFSSLTMPSLKGRFPASPRNRHPKINQIPQMKQIIAENKIPSEKPGNSLDLKIF